MKNKLKFTFNEFSRRVKAACDAAELNGIWIGVLATSVAFISVFYMVLCFEYRDLKVASAKDAVKWQKEVDAMRFQFQDTRDALSKLRSVYESDMDTTQKNFQILDKEVQQLQKNKADLPNVWNGAKLND